MIGLRTTVKIIVCLVFPVGSRQETPQYSYECKENGNIVLHGFSNNNSSYIQLISANNHTLIANETCFGTIYSADTFGHITIPKECTNGTDVKTNRSAVFRAVDYLIDGTTPTTTTTTLERPTTTTLERPTTTTLEQNTTEPITTTQEQSTAEPSTTTEISKKKNLTPSFGQRNHNFRIQCSVITQGVVDHVIGHVGVKNVALLPNVYNSVGTVEMRFKSEEASKENKKDIYDLPDISTVYLGDKFYMYLKYIGDQGYIISPQKCTAYGDNEKAVVDKGDKRTKNVLLWTYNGCLSNDSRDLHLMHSFKQLTNKTVYAEMFGFHFDVDADITIECDVKVCTYTSPSYTTCAFKGPEFCKTNDWKIVKRSTREEEDNRVTVKGKLHVLERKIGNSNSSGFLQIRWTCLVIMQFLLYLY